MMKLPLPDEQPIAVNALRRMRAKISGEIEMHSRELDRLRATLVHIDATLWLFDPETDPNVKAKSMVYRRGGAKVYQ